MTLRLHGTVQDRLTDAAGSVRLQTRPEPNMIVHGLLDCIGGLLTNRPDAGGALFLAVGAGAEEWDAAAPAPDRNRAALHREVYRKRLLPGDISFDPATGVLTVRSVFLPGEATGPLRETGLFGGAASPWPNSGILLNHRVHTLVIKGEDETLQREILLTFAPDQADPALVELIGRLLANQPGLRGISHSALGAGLDAWGDPPPPPEPGVNRLAAEFFRKRLPSVELNYNRLTQTVSGRVRFAYQEGPAVTREFGLFGGAATDERETGTLLLTRRFAAIDRNRPPSVLTQSFELRLGASVVIPAPDLTGLTREEAVARLEAVALVAGGVTERESAGPAGLVLSQDPAPGVLIAEGLPVSIVVSVPPPVEVPSLAGLTTDEAAAVLAGAGLALGQVTEREAEPPLGIVLSQQPPAGLLVPAGSVVALEVSVARRVEVPSVLGLTAAAAALRLTASELGLHPDPPEVEESKTGWGLIARQDPAAGTLVPIGTAVRIVVFGGWTVQVPDLDGLTPAEAEKALREAAEPAVRASGASDDRPGLAIGHRDAVASRERFGLVVRQSPRPGELVPLYATVEVGVATPAEVVVPKLAGLSRAAALQSLADAGLVPGEVTTIPDRSAAAGTVLAQQPAAGASVRMGALVELTVASLPDVIVPNVVGQHRAAAEELLLELGLRPQFVEIPPTATAALRIGLVLRQRTAPSTVVPLGSTIVLEVVAPANQPRVPSVLGLTAAQARATLAAANFPIAIGGTALDPQFPADVVVAQDPAAGAAAAAGTTVTVTLNSPLRVTAIAFSPSPVASGQPVSITIRLSTTVHQGAQVRVRANSSLLVPPTAVNVPANTGSLTFTARTLATERAVTVVVTAELNNTSFEASLVLAANVIQPVRPVRFLVETNPTVLRREAEGFLQPLIVTVSGGTPGAVVDAQLTLTAPQLLEGQRPPVIDAAPLRLRSEVRWGGGVWAIRLSFSMPASGEARLTLAGISLRAGGLGTIALALAVEPSAFEVSPRALTVAQVIR